MALVLGADEDSGMENRGAPVQTRIGRVGKRAVVWRQDGADGPILSTTVRGASARETARWEALVGAPSPVWGLRSVTRLEDSAVRLVCDALDLPTLGSYVEGQEGVDLAELCSGVSVDAEYRDLSVPASAQALLDSTGAIRIAAVPWLQIPWEVTRWSLGAEDELFLEEELFGVPPQADTVVAQKPSQPKRRNTSRMPTAPKKSSQRKRSGGKRVSEESPGQESPWGASLSQEPLSDGTFRNGALRIRRLREGKLPTVEETLKAVRGSRGSEAETLGVQTGSQVTLPELDETLPITAPTPRVRVSSLRWGQLAAAGTVTVFAVGGWFGWRWYENVPVACPSQAQAEVELDRLLEIRAQGIERMDAEHLALAETGSLYESDRKIIAELDSSSTQLTGVSFETLGLADLRCREASWEATAIIQQGAYTACGPNGCIQEEPEQMRLHLSLVRKQNRWLLTEAAPTVEAQSGQPSAE